ncbi:PLP-dependent aspartate aminotransferase family protein [Pelagibacteraceae bacterium]|nr:PLP-dependent aspartate aminotransferase family protein [Pelagibacteraceae bacterium]
MVKRKKSYIKKINQFDTLSVHAGVKPDPLTGAVMTPIYATSTYAHSKPGLHKGYEYSRSQNPTREVLEDSLAAIESGFKAFAFASGVAAQTAVLDLLKPGDHVIAFDDLYGGTFRLFNEIKAKSSGIEFTFLDLNTNFSKEIKSNTKMIWIETPTNPLLKITDLKRIARIARKNKLLTVCDNTFATPYNQRPLEHGIDIVNHSTTKYINGHSDVIGGALIIGKNKKLEKKLSLIQNSTGAVPSPFDCFLTLRGIKTLALRMKKHNENGIKVARFLRAHKKTLNVTYPGLPNHKQKDIAQKQMIGFGGMITFIFDGSMSDISKFMRKLKIFTIAESLGGVESLIESPALMTHAYLEDKSLNQVPKKLVRLSVGIEDSEDLIEDLNQALK